MASPQPAVLETLSEIGPRRDNMHTTLTRVGSAFDWYQRHVTSVWVAIAVVLGALQAAYFRYFINPDGISYLDMGEAYLRGDWSSALRGHWSPLYGVLVAGAVRIVRPGPGTEFPLVHLVNFGLYLVALGTFTFLVRQMQAALTHPSSGGRALIGLPAWAWTSVSYAVFIACTLQYGLVELVTPDLLVAVLVFAIGGLVLRGRGSYTWRSSVLLGALLGLGYLAKAPMLPLAPVFLVASTLLVRGRMNRTVHAGLAVLALALVAVPFVTLLSVSKGRITVGDSAALNYLWMIDGVRPLAHWQGGPEGSGQPVHRTELLMEQPDVYTFGGPFNVTYSPWYAPDYWYEGGTPHFVLAGQVRAIRDGLALYGDMAKHLAVPLGGLAILLLLRSRVSRAGLAPALALIVPAAAAFGMYGLVLVEERYVAPFVVLLLLGLFGLVRPRSGLWRSRLATGLTAVVLVGLLVPVGIATVGHSRAVISDLARGDVLGGDEQARVALALESAGVQAGAPVASGGRAVDDAWARLARVRIIAEVSDRDGAATLLADAGARERVQQVLLHTPVRAVVARQWPGLTNDPQWRSIDGTTYFYRLVDGA